MSWILFEMQCMFSAVYCHSNRYSVPSLRSWCIKKMWGPAGEFLWSTFSIHYLITVRWQHRGYLNFKKPTVNISHRSPLGDEVESGSIVENNAEETRTEEVLVVVSVGHVIPTMLVCCNICIMCYLYFDVCCSVLIVACPLLYIVFVLCYIAVVTVELNVCLCWAHCDGCI